MKKKKGFTLIELLAVIVILAIIALISTPIIIGVIEKARKGAFEDSAYGVLDAGRIYFVDKIADQNKFEGASFTFPDGGDLKVSGEKPAGGEMQIYQDGNISFALYDKDKKWCVLKLNKEEKVEIMDYKESTCKDYHKVDDYVKEGLLVHYDAISNAGKNIYDPNATIWKNLASNTFDGVLHNGAQFVDQALYLDGVDDWVGIGAMNSQTITIEIVTEVVGNSSNSDDENVVIDNYEGGGYGISVWKDSQTVRGQVYKVPTGYIGESFSYKLNQKMYLAVRASKDLFTVHFNSNSKIGGGNGQEIGEPANHTIFVIGGNAFGNNAVYGFYNGKVYAVRIYNRVLTEAEIAQNRQTDFNRFGISNN